MRTVYVRNPAITIREEDPDGGLLLDPATNRLQVLNGVGMFLWSLCDGTRDQSGLVARIQDSFEDVPAARVAEDVRDFLNAMVSAGFVIAREPADS
ncbi:MAG: PqqD family peptide modification chaperone [Chitinivibrionales bacterium]|nr:PqqD family peptide modification chaperone [Chitinivibrionales bacterium]